MKLKFYIVFILSIICVFISANLLKAEKIDIQKEIQAYKNHFVKSKDCGDISSKIEAFDKYLDDAVLMLNKELNNDKQLYAKIEKYGRFENNKVIVQKDRDKQLDDYVQYLNNNGIKIGYSEGDIYLYSDPMYIYSTFKKVLPNYINEYYENGLSISMA